MHEIEPARELIQVILGHIVISNSTQIQRESVLIHTFISTVEILNSTITDIEFDEVSFEVVASTLVIQNTQFSSLTSTNSRDFILGTFGSTVSIERVNVSNSETPVFRSLQSATSVNTLSLTNISSPEYVFKIESSSGVSLNNITLDN